MNFFQGCTALITGASSGIGAELARQLAPDAKVLILVARRLDRLEALRAELARPSLTIHIHLTDLTDETQTASLLQTLAASGEKITLLINCAGLGDHGLFEKSAEFRVREMLEVNVKALTQITQAIIPSMVRNAHGAVLNVSSIAALLPIPKLAVYAATKAYVNSFSEALRGELRGTGVSVTTLCPGPVDTEFFGNAVRLDSSESMPSPRIFKVHVQTVAKAGLRAVRRDHARAIPGWFVCTVMNITSLIPIFFLRLGFGLGRRKHP